MLDVAYRQQIVRSLLEEVDRRLTFDKIKYYQPYEKQKQFHDEGKEYHERALIAGNQVGKTYAGACEVAYHLTGDYPAWWAGHRYDKPVRFLAASVTSETLRDGMQRVMFGQVNMIGSGAIPKDKIVRYVNRTGVKGAIASAEIKHISGYTSFLILKPYSSGREKFQGDTIDGVWLDEEPPSDIYTEISTRINAVKNSMLMLTATPLKGNTEVVTRFTDPENRKKFKTSYVNMTLYDAGHYTKDQIETIRNKYSEHERRARCEGVPLLGSGAVFPFEQAKIGYGDLENDIKQRIKYIVGIDFGKGDHPTACVKCGYDLETGIFYVMDTLIIASPIYSEVIEQIKNRFGSKVPCAYPHDGLFRDVTGEGKTIAEHFRKHGLNMLPNHASHEKHKHYVEPTISEIIDEMDNGRFKINRALNDIWRELTGYHRDNGKIVKNYDDLIDAMRYAYVSRVQARNGNEKTDTIRSDGVTWN